MAYKFQSGDPVFYTPKEPEFENLKGIYTVVKLNSTGENYRVMDRGNNYTDADEDELDFVMYAVFTTVEHGWPIIVPVFDETMYAGFLNSNKYKFVCESTAAGCLDEQTSILKTLEEQGSEE